MFCFSVSYLHYLLQKTAETEVETSIYMFHFRYSVSLYYNVCLVCVPPHWSSILYLQCKRQRSPANICVVCVVYHNCCWHSWESLFAPDKRLCVMIMQTLCQLLLASNLWHDSINRSYRFVRKPTLIIA